MPLYENFYAELPHPTTVIIPLLNSNYCLKISTSTIQRQNAVLERAFTRGIHLKNIFWEYLRNKGNSNQIILYVSKIRNI